MKDLVIVRKINEVNMQIEAPEGVKRQISEFFSFEIPDKKWHPLVKAKLWDGIMRLFLPHVGVLYLGLIRELAVFCRDNDYRLKIEFDIAEQEFSYVEAEAFVKKHLNGRDLRPYQVEAFAHVVKRKRAFLLCPTSAGKTFINYLITQYHSDIPILVVLPKLGLVEQIHADYLDYGANGEDLQIISGDAPKRVTRRIVFATWQSIYKMPQTWFDQFEGVIVDEGHGATAKSLTAILEKCTNAYLRIGMSGTLDGSNLHRYVLIGLFGAIKQVTTTKKLMDAGWLSRLKLKGLILKYPDKICRAFYENKLTFKQEQDFLVQCKQRNNFIKNLALSLKGNTLILFQFITHGELLYKLLQGKGKKVYLAHGEIDGSIREDIRRRIEIEKDIIVIASYGTFGVGTNMIKLHNVIAASGYKAIIPTLQAIGRGLRKSKEKSEAAFFDIADDLTHKSSQNATIRHFGERSAIYEREKFDFKKYEISLNFPSMIRHQS